MTHERFPVKHALALTAAALPAGCLSLTGPCEVGVEFDASGQRTARVQCAEGGSAAILAPANAIHAIEGHRASEAKP